MPKEKEMDIVRAILSYLKIKGFLCKRNNSGLLFMGGKDGKNRAIKVGEAGWPDIEGLTSKGRYFGIEVKTKKGKLQPNQKELGDEIKRRQGIWFVARSIDDVIAEGF